MEEINQNVSSEQAVKEVEEARQDFEDRRMEQLEKENAVLKQNAAAAAKAPVRGVAAGAGQSASETDFEKGLFSDPW